MLCDYPRVNGLGTSQPRRQTSQVATEAARSDAGGYHVPLRGRVFRAVDADWKTAIVCGCQATIGMELRRLPVRRQPNR